MLTILKNGTRRLDNTAIWVLGSFALTESQTVTHPLTHSWQDDPGSCKNPALEAAL